MPPGKPWAYGNMSMRNPMSRAPMNNNPMGNQAPMTMQPNFGRAVGAAGSTSLPYAGGSLGMAGPATAVQGMSAMRPAPVRQAPQSTPYRRAMSGDPIFGQNGIGVQRAAQNVLMGQPMGADTRMRGLNIPGMTFDPATNSMVRAPRPQLTSNPNLPARMNTPTVGPGTAGEQSRMNTRISRMARARGVRGGDIPEWSRLSPAAIAMRQRAGEMPGSAGPTGGNPAPMGPSQGPPAANTIAGAATVTPPAAEPPSISERISQVVSESGPVAAAFAPAAASRAIFGPAPSPSQIAAGMKAQGQVNNFGNMAKYANANTQGPGGLAGWRSPAVPYSLGGFMPHWSQAGMEGLAARQAERDAALNPTPYEPAPNNPETEEMLKQWRAGGYSQGRMNMPFGRLSR